MNKNFWPIVFLKLVNDTVFLIIFLTVNHLIEKLYICVFLGHVKTPPVQNQPSLIGEPLTNQIRVRGNSDSEKKCKKHIKQINE